MSINVNNPNGYIFNRNLQGSIRLNYQHYLMTQLTGNELLHKSTKELIDASAPLRVADIATGTAIWPLSLARAYPHWQVDGFDISKAQYPFASSIPANVSLYEHNTFQPFPVEYHGKYDIVNVRFMITLLDKEKVRLLLQSLKMILKPGGILQWFEPIAFNVQAVAPEGIEAPWNSKVAEIMRFNPPDCADWITLNCDMVKPEGYEPVAWDELHFQEIHRPIWMQTCLMGMTEVIAGLAQSTDEADRAQREGLEQLMVGWEKEYEQGAYVEMPWYFLVARKPVDST